MVYGERPVRFIWRLPLTIPSIEQHILNPLSVPEVSTDIFFHSFSISLVTSSWAHETNSRIPGARNELDIFLKFNLVRYEITDQNLFDRSALANTSNIFLQSEYPPGVTLNALRALYSLLRVSELRELETSLHQRDYYRGVLFIRPDLQIVSTLDVNQLVGLRHNDLLSPKYDHYGGLNDRLCACGVAAAEAFGKRILRASEFGRKHKFRSEMFNLWAVTTGNVNVSKTLVVCGIRVRSSGTRRADDCMHVSFH